MITRVKNSDKGTGHFKRKVKMLEPLENNGSFRTEWSRSTKECSSLSKTMEKGIIKTSVENVKQICDAPKVSDIKLFSRNSMSIAIEL